MSKSNKKSKFRNRQLYLMILRCILQDQNYLAEIARELQKSPQLLQHYLKILRRYGYIRPVTETRSYPVIYELTEKARIVISNAERMGRSGGFRFHHFALKYRILADNRSFLPAAEGSRLNGVSETTGKFEGYRIRRWHSASADWLYVYSRHMYGRFPWQLLCAASIELDRIVGLIECRYHMRLKFECVLQKPELEDSRDPIAKFWGEYYGNNVRTNSGSGIDASEGPWAIELSYDDAVSHVLLARNIAQILSVLRSQQELLREFLAQLGNILKQGTEGSTNRPPTSRLWS